jgi:hypothetical protein
MRAETGSMPSARDLNFDELVLETARLRRLWLALQRTRDAIVTSVAAYQESQDLLRRIERLNGRESPDHG